MKTRLAGFIVLLFLVACGSSDQSTAKDETGGAPKNLKFIIKAFNSQFVSVTADGALVPNQTDPTKATVFEKIDLGNGKCALKTSAGKYVCDDRDKRSFLLANRDTNGEWETFEIIALDETRASIKTSFGKYVCSDGEHGDTLIGNRETAGNWETFDLQIQE